MQYKKGTRTMGRVSVCLAFVSLILVFAGPASASEEFATTYEHGHDQFSVYLSGDEVRDGGDREGRGFARLDLDPDNERVCYVITWNRLEGDVTALHQDRSGNGSPADMELRAHRHQVVVAVQLEH